MWGSLLLLYFVAGSYQISISEFSVPQSIEFGENATLKCLYELSPGENDKALYVKWWWTPINGTSDNRHQLYQRIAGYSPERIYRKDIIINENDGISLENATAEDSGTYECEVSNFDEVRKHGELIVYKLGDGPVLNITLNVTADGPDEDSEEDVLALVTCAASDVAPEPNLVITVNGNEIETEKMVELSSENTYDILETAILSKENADGADIVCRLVIEPVNVTHPVVGEETLYFKSTTQTTTEDDADLSTTEASSDPLQYTNVVTGNLPVQYLHGVSFGPTSCALLVITTFLFRLAVN